MTNTKATRLVHFIAWGACLSVVLALGASASAQPKGGGSSPSASASASAAPPLSPEDARAREEFRAGAKLVEESEWASALAAFERSASIKPHVLTTYNIGVCQRYLGRYTLAAQTLRTAVSPPVAAPPPTQDSATPTPTATPPLAGTLPDLFREQAAAYLTEIDKKLARVTIALTPPDATTAFDGRPVIPAGAGGDELIAGIAPPGDGKKVGPTRFTVIVDPGLHVLTFHLEGHDTIEVRRDLKPGARDEVAVSLTEQNAELHIDADRPKSVVRVDNVDVGLTPIAVTRPPGRHNISVAKDGFVTYGTTVTLRPGQRTRLAADLPVEHIPLTKRWWFWTGVAAVVATGALVTYFVARPDPEPPPYEGGSTGWIVPVP